MPVELSQIDEQACYDVVIAGAGMVGASTALGLDKLGYKVLLLDAFSFDSELPEYTPSYDARSTALSWGTREILEQLEVWTEIEEHACPITKVHVSEKGRFGTTRIDSDDYAHQALGYVVPNQWLGRCLLQGVYKQGVEFVSGVKVSDFCAGVSLGACNTGGDSQYQVSISGQKGEQRQINTKLLIVADGTESATAKLMGIEYDIDHYAQHAMVVNVSTSDDHHGVAYERFTKAGPLAMLPLASKTCALVWTHDDSVINEYMDMADEDFCRALEDSFGERLGLIEKCGKRAAYPLRLVKAKEQCRQGVLLLGNSAHSLHPVAGQGFNLAIRGVAAFLEYAANCEAGIGELSSLRALCESRQMDQIKTIMMSDQLIKIFGTEWPLLDHGRDLGLLGMDNIKPLKAAFSSQAMGLAGRKAKWVS